MKIDSKLAKEANPDGFVVMFCKGKCEKTVLAQLDKDYPGKDLLKNADLGSYHATCSCCGGVQSDSYNWIPINVSVAI